MLNKIFAFFKSHFGISDNRNSLMSNPEAFGEEKSYKRNNNSTSFIMPFSQRKSLSRQRKNTLRLQKIFMIGFNLFNAGDREEAIPILKQVLDDPFKVPTYRMVSACMIGETFRGMGKFNDADDFYELSIYESDLRPVSSRKGNEWYEHYRPRATFGLITILRRNLSTNHELIKQLLNDARDQYQEYRNQDLMAQLNVVEGVYFRQLGDIDGSIHYINSGIENTLLMAPPYLFWHPEHFQAMLLLSYVSDPGYLLQGSRLAKRMISEERNPWSNAIALSATIKLFLSRIFNNSNSTNPKDNINKKQFSNISNLFERLNENVLFEKDPFLTTEIITLEAIWNCIISNENRVFQEIEQLDEYMTENASDPIWLLRSVELAAIKGILLKNINDEPKEILVRIWKKGVNILHRYSDALKSYGCKDSLIKQLDSLLTNQTIEQNQFKNFDSESVRMLRLRLLP